MKLTSVAVQVFRMEAMVAFYSEAFGVLFEDVVTSGFASKFGKMEDLLLKFVPLREKVDFENYQVHQLGFEVDSIPRIQEVCIKHGGSLEGTSAIRDPDGNTLELYQAQ